MGGCLQYQTGRVAEGDARLVWRRLERNEKLKFVEWAAAVLLSPPMSTPNFLNDDFLLTNHVARELYHEHAAELPILSSMVAEAFARDTHASSHLQTAALPYVWTDPAMFAKAVHQLRLDSDALQLAVGGTDQSRIDHAIHSLDTTCTQCHREFRAE